MLLGEVGAGLHAEVFLIDLGARYHLYSVLDWAHGMANGTTGAILLHDFRERVVPIELNGLVA
jgi:hypothetical protein